jgi:hypothetical protein
MPTFSKHSDDDDLDQVASPVRCGTCCRGVSRQAGSAWVLPARRQNRQRFLALRRPLTSFAWAVYSAPDPAVIVALWREQIAVLASRRHSII